MELTGEMFCKMIIDPFNSVDESKNVKKRKIQNWKICGIEVRKFDIRNWTWGRV